MKRVIIESPYAGDVERNLRYARAAMQDCLFRGEAPFASYLLYTQEGILDDNMLGERQLGIDAGLAWGEVADLVAVYKDLGITKGMTYGIERHNREGRIVEFRSLDAWKSKTTESGRANPIGIMPRAQMDGLKVLGWNFMQIGSNEWEWIRFGCHGEIEARQGSGAWRDDLASTRQRTTSRFPPFNLSGTITGRL